MDVETTGLTVLDRVVSIALVSVERSEIKADGYTASASYFVFNPERQSHPAAQRVHGWKTVDLKRQPPFAAFAPKLAEAVEWANVVVAHNAQFDRSFVLREMEIAGVPMPDTRWECTQKMLGGRASLSRACEERLGLFQGEVHSALHDASLCMLLYFHLLGSHQPFSLGDVHGIAPMNYVPPRPRGRPKKDAG